MYSRKIAAVLTVILLCLTSLLFNQCKKINSLNTVSSEALVGSSKLDVDISSSGKVNLSFELEVPPGTNNLKPELTLVNNGGTTNGALGVGWSLSGISKITRVGKSLLHDGMWSSVAFTQEDRFAFNGMRLIAVKDSSGNQLTTLNQRNQAYSKTGTIYHTANETWTKVTGYGSGAKGPDSLIAYDKDGRCFVFGNSANTRINSFPFDGSTIVSWLLSSISDTNGNRIIYSYKKGLRTAVVSEISYNTNPKVGMTEGAKKVLFGYSSNRTDSLGWYQAGLNFQNPYLLDTITTMVYNKIAKRVYLNYKVVNNLSVLSQISEADQNNNSLPPITLDVSQASNGLKADSTYGVKGNSIVYDGSWSGTWMSDVDGDGLKDFVYFTQKIDFPIITPGEWYVLKNKGIGFASESHFGKIPSFFGNDGKDSWMADMNGDGLTDFVYKKVGEQEIYVALSTGKTFETPRKWGQRSKSPQHQYNQYLVDMNGDGLIDYVYYKDKQVHVLENTGDNSFSSDKTYTTLDHGIGYDSQSLWFIDLNKDHYTDVIYKRNDENELRAQLNTGLSTFGKESIWLNRVHSATHNYTQWFVDVNTDGLPDHIYNPTTNPKEYHVILNTGTSFIKSSIWGVRNYGVGYSGSADWIQDMNNDGKPDIVYKRDDHSDYYVKLNSGAGFESDIIWAIRDHGIGVDGYCKWWDDIDGDGAVDFIYKQDGSDKLNAMLSGKAIAPLLVTKVENKGSEMVTDVSYGPMTDSKIYIPVNPYNGNMPKSYLKYLRKVKGSDYLVKNMRHTNHGKSRNQSVLYGTKYRMINGIGSLGFHGRYITDLEAGTLRAVYFKQSFPGVGQVDSILLAEANTNFKKLLAKEYYSYIHSSIPLDAGPIGTSWILPQTKSVDKMYKGVIAYTSRETYTYDQFGNVTLLENQPDISDPVHVLYTGAEYLNDTLNWNIGKLLHKKYSKSSKIQFDSWNSLSDLSWDKYAYDDNANKSMESNYSDHESKWLDHAYRYNDYGNVVCSTDFLGGTEILSYDPLQCFITERKVPTSKGDTLVVMSTYDPAFGTLTSTTDANAQRTTYEIDGLGRTTGMYSPAPSGDLVKVAAYGLLSMDGLSIYKTQKRTSWTDDDINNWFWSYEVKDGFNNTLKELSLGDKGDTIAIIHKYDNQNLKIAESLPLSTGDTDTIWTEFTHDIYGNVDTIKTDLSVTAFQINPTNNSITKTISTNTGLERVTVTYYTPSGKIDHIIDAEGGETQYYYDLLDREILIRDPSKIVTNIKYNSLGDKLKITSEDIGTRLYAYTNGLLTQEVSGSGNNAIDYTYDLAGRVTSKLLKWNNGENTKKIIYTFDGDANENLKGQLASVAQIEQDTISSSFFTYNTQGNIATVVTSLGQDNSYTFSYQYGPQGNMIGMTYPDQSVVQYDHYENGLLKSIELAQWSGGKLGQFEPFVAYENYTSIGQAQAISYLNGANDVFLYDQKTNLLKQHHMTISSDTMIHAHYVWDDLYQLDSIKDLRTSGNTHDTLRFYNDSQAFWHSKNGRLDSAYAPYTYGMKRYNYSAGGDLILKDGITFSSRVGHRVSEGEKDGRIVYNAAYDDSGRLTRKTMDSVIWDYSFDAQGNLLTVSRDKQLVNKYSYGPAGERLKKTSYLLKDSTETVYLGDSYEIETAYKDGHPEINHTKFLTGMDGKVVSLSAAADNVTLASNKTSIPANSTKLLLSKRDDLVLWPIYLVLLVLMFLVVWNLKRIDSIFGFSRTFVIRSVAVVMVFVMSVQTTLPLFALGKEVKAEKAGANQGPSIRYFHKNRVGSLSLVTDQNGMAISRTVYDPFGAIDISHSTGLPEQFDFAGKEWNQQTGLYYFNARYYDPFTARFITPDTEAGSESGHADAYNRYAYSLNNPITYTDPSGHFVISTLIVAAVVGAMIGAAVEIGVQLATHGRVDSWEEVLEQAAIGAATGMVGAGVGAAISEGLLKAVAVQGLEMSASRLTAVRIGIGLVSGVASGVSAQLTQNGMNKAFGNHVGWDDNLKMAAITGGIFGIAGSAYNSKVLPATSSYSIIETSPGTYRVFQYTGANWRTVSALGNEGYMRIYAKGSKAMLPIAVALGELLKETRDRRGAQNLVNYVDDKMFSSKIGNIGSFSLTSVSQGRKSSYLRAVVGSGWTESEMSRWVNSENGVSKQWE